ncbi:MAG: phosphate ABC transporter substrate-binding protein PstS [Gammaproteobacteria bacterium]|nr:phosphate ABC transporter substrate-binding protein PstS [Gammaproteobacteria bacterium]
MSTLQKFFLLGCLLFSSFAKADVSQITGAGATFPYPIYAKWAEAWYATSNVALNYQPIGSGGGIRQIEAGTVDFGASDLPLDSAALKEKGLMQFPAIIGAVVPVIHLDGVPNNQLKLNGDVLAKIWLGKITHWNDPAIIALNPTLHLPDKNITVVHRSDGSGTTYLFTDYLAKVNEDWKKNIGTSTAVNWPVGVGGKGNEGVAAYVQRIDGAIGYVEFAYAKQNQLSYIQLQNHDGQFVSPSLQSFSDAAAHANWSEKNNFAEVLTDVPGANSWPITGASFILLKTHSKNIPQVQSVLAFFDWAWLHGGETAVQLDYVPLTQDTIKHIHEAWKSEIQ